MVYTYLPRQKEEVTPFTQNITNSTSKEGRVEGKGREFQRRDQKTDREVEA